LFFANFNDALAKSKGIQVRGREGSILNKLEGCLNRIQSKVTAICLKLLAVNLFVVAVAQFVRHLFAICSSSLQCN